MSKQNDGGPAFPSEGETQHGSWIQTYDSGMSLREYAAIKLCVPDSGTDWLDDMIRTALQDRFAGMALQGIWSRELGVSKGDKEQNLTLPFIAETAYEQADVMLAKRANEQAENC